MMDNLGVAMNATTIEAYALEKGINFKWNTASQAEKSEMAMQMFLKILNSTQEILRKNLLKQYQVLLEC